MSRKNARIDKRNQLDADIARLNASISTLSQNIDSFAHLPLSDATQKGLHASKFTTLTPIQSKSIPLALKGHDILGAARTGSGKTLAFLIPMLELLYRNKWGPMDGLGALIISPTRELAVQIFDVLCKIGAHHSFSAGLVIGGKALKDEKERLARMNILIATPGRLLQHMDQTIGFQADNLQMLVLDEADRCMDLGFQKTLDAILQHLPPSSTRQSLLFSATQSKSIASLARLSLRSPEYVTTNTVSADTFEIPTNLSQNYMLVDLDKKLDLLWSFIKSHMSSKTIVFLSSCKQVRFVYETFRHLRPGISLLHLHGKQKQQKRLEIFQKFTHAEHAVLFATDIAARGLDFPDVSWVVQVDAPEDTDTYIHRVGRTARYTAKGKSLIMLCPSEEEGMLANFEKKGINVSKIKAKDSKQQSVQNQFQSLAFQFPEIKFLAQRAFISYVRSIHLQKDKAVFKLSELPLEAYATSLGLAGTPKIKFATSKTDNKIAKNASRLVASTSTTKPKPTPAVEETESESETELSEAKKPKSKIEKMFGRKNQNILSEHYNKVVARSASPTAETDDFLTLARADHALAAASDEEDAETANISKRKLKMGTTKKGLVALRGSGEKLTFDEDGKAHALYELQDEASFANAGDVKAQIGEFVGAEGKRMGEVDVEDRVAEREKRREKKRRKKERESQADDDQVRFTAPMVEDDDVLDNLPLVESDDEPAPKPKKSKKRKASPVEDDMEDLEAMALKAMGR